MIGARGEQVCVIGQPAGGRAWVPESGVNALAGATATSAHGPPPTHGTDVRLRPRVWHILFRLVGDLFQTAGRV